MYKIKRKLLIEKSYLTGKYCLPPEFLSLVITWKCNFRCRACSIWKKEKSTELTDEQWLEIADDLKKFFSQKTFVEINGGEPLLRRELTLKLIKKLKNNFKLVTLNSNGSLINAETIQALEEAGLDVLKISFYSLEKEIHNFLRGSSEAYEQALQALKLVIKSRIKLEIGILITAKNILQIPALIEYLNNFDNLKIILQPLDESIESFESKNKNWNNMLVDLWPKNKEIKTFFSWVLNNKKNIKNSSDNIRAIERYYLNPPSVLQYRCFAGQRSCIIYPQGEMTLCFKGEVIGNIKKERIGEILSAEGAYLERKNIKNCKKYCRIIGCNFSRGLKEFIRNSVL